MTHLVAAWRMRRGFRARVRRQLAARLAASGAVRA